MSRPRVATAPQKAWRSCCFMCERSFVVFITQTLLGMSILAFCAHQLSGVDYDCNRATPYWGLVGTICGFFFRKISFQSKSTGRSGVDGVTSESRSPIE